MQPFSSGKINAITIGYICAICIGTISIVACRPKPFIVAAPPHYSVETGTERAHPTAPSRVYRDIWEAIQNVDIPAALRLSQSHEQTQITYAIESLIRGDVTQAQRTALPLLAAEDSTVRMAARLTYGAALSSRSDWAKLAAFSDSLRNQQPYTGQSSDAAGIEAWARAFRSIHTTSSYSNTPSDTLMVLPLQYSPSGTPIIQVYLNGVLKRLWIDTGASISILSSTTAADCGVVPITNDTLELMTSVGRLSARPGVLKSTYIGGLHLENAPTMIVDANALTIPTQRTEAGIDGTQRLRIDGIIGWDIIRTIDLTIDDINRRIIVRQPKPKVGGAQSNVFWFGVPIVTLTASNGAKLHLSLDTGAEETYGTRSFAVKTRARSVVAERRYVQGFGAQRRERGVVIPSVRLYLGSVPVRLERLFLYNARYPTIFELDGTLGADVFNGNIVRLDLANGRFEIVIPRDSSQKRVNATGHAARLKTETFNADTRW